VEWPRAGAPRPLATPEGEPRPELAELGRGVRLPFPEPLRSLLLKTAVRLFRAS
jgi:hypothetical protein